jgi:hypothetical protein
LSFWKLSLILLQLAHFGTFWGHVFPFLSLAELDSIWVSESTESFPLFKTAQEEGHHA